MPPQRRKIIPPATTSKVRRKVAGAGKPASDSAASAPALNTEPQIAEAKTAEPQATEPQTAEPAAKDEGSATATSASSTLSLDKTPAVESAPKTTAPKTAAPTATAPAPTAPAAQSASGIGFKHVIAVAVIAVVLGAFAAIAAFKPFATIDNAAWVDSASTQEVTSAATDALQTLYTYKAATIDADFDAARAVLNQSMLEEFNSTAETTKSAVVQTDTGTEAMVTDIGVSLLEDDKAELIANVNISATQNGAASGSAEGPLTVNMEKVDGTWKLSAIDDQ